MNLAKSSLLILTLLAAPLFGASAEAGQYVVTATNGPTFESPEEAVRVLESTILPLFDALTQLEEKGTIRGGLPVGDRAFTFVLVAKSNQEADRTLRALPAWALFEWDVVALQSIADRAAQERAAVKAIKAANK